jgi:hypothetical protein
MDRDVSSSTIAGSALTIFVQKDFVRQVCGGLLNESCRLVHALSGQGHVCDSTAGVEAKGYLVEAGTDGISNYE